MYTGAHWSDVHRSTTSVEPSRQAQADEIPPRPLQYVLCPSRLLHRPPRVVRPCRLSIPVRSRRPAMEADDGIFYFDVLDDPQLPHLRYVRILCRNHTADNYNYYVFHNDNHYEDDPQPQHLHCYWFVYCVVPVDCRKLKHNGTTSNAHLAHTPITTSCCTTTSQHSSSCCTTTSTTTTSSGFLSGPFVFIRLCCRVVVCVAEEERVRGRRGGRASREEKFG